MASSHLALHVKDFDNEVARQLTVVCPACDPDNPTAVPSKTCPMCHGTRRSPIKLLEIVSEIRESQKPQSYKTSFDDCLLVDY